jgi:hypothetical protein
MGLPARIVVSWAAPAAPAAAQSVTTADVSLHAEQIATPVGVATQRW